MHRAKQTENFYKSLHMLQANNLLRESDSSSPFEDYSIFMYRQSAPQFNDRVKDLEKKLLHPVSENSTGQVFICLRCGMLCAISITLTTTHQQLCVFSSCFFLCSNFILSSAIGKKKKTFENIALY